MKKYSIFILCLILLFSCSSDEDVPSFSNLVKSNLISGSWIIKYYSHGGLIDDTSNYNGYVLTFKSNGTIIVTKNDEILNGTYSFRDEKINEYPVYYLILNFNGSQIFQNLNSNSWEIYGNLTDEIDLKIDASDFLKLKK